MSLKDSFSEELRYLHELGNDFAKDNPQLARLLGKGASDPDVERLMEAFAFLTAKLRLKLEDDLPELTHPMLQLLWPNYLRPLPSATIIQFSRSGNPSASHSASQKGRGCSRNGWTVWPASFAPAQRSTFIRSRSTRWAPPRHSTVPWSASAFKHWSSGR